MRRNIVALVRKIEQIIGTHLFFGVSGAINPSKCFFSLPLDTVIAIALVPRVGLNVTQVDEVVYRSVGETLNGIRGIIVVNSEEL